MTEIDDKLLEQFFNKQKKDIADNGFSTRVMHSLPNRSNKMASVLITISVIISVILFFALDGLHVILRLFREIFVSAMQNGAMNLDLKALLVAGAVLLFMGVRKIYSME